MVRNKSLIMLGTELNSPEQSVRPYLPLRTEATFRFCRCITFSAITSRTALFNYITFLPPTWSPTALRVMDTPCAFYSS
jgi:hypothetical protein